MNALTTFESLVSSLDGRNLVVVEGARCTGKDHLIRRLRDRIAYHCYEILHPRKKFMEALSGRVSNLPAGLDIQQGHLWAMDLVRQLPDVKVLMNRSMLSSLHFDGWNKERMEMWTNMLKVTNGIVILLLPSERVHARRIASAGRSAESESIYAERVGIQRFASMIPSEHLLVFCEP